MNTTGVEVALARGEAKPLKVEAVFVRGW